MTEVSPLHMGLGRLGYVDCHRSNNVGLSLGAMHESHSQDRTSCHICHEKGQAMVRWCIVSVS